MRWFVWLVALCLMAAGVARPPAPRTLDRPDATVEDASALATLVPRRPTVFAPDKRSDRRIDLHAAPAIRAAPDVTHTVLATSVVPPTRVPARTWFARAARGPPAGRSTISNPLHA